MSSMPSRRARVRLTQTWFEIRRSPIQGRGAFAVRSIRAGTRIIEYTGERIGHARFAVRYASEAKGRHHTFLLLATRRTVIDGRVHGNESKYINHSCDPNCRVVREKGRVYFETCKNVRKGEELAFDYWYARDGTETAADEARARCRCGTRKCRGSIMRPKAAPAPATAS